MERELKGLLRGLTMAVSCVTRTKASVALTVILASIPDWKATCL